jgi:hypothetical protein
MQSFRQLRAIPTSSRGYNSSLRGFGFFFGLPAATLAYDPEENLVWNFSIRPAVSMNFSLPV